MKIGTISEDSTEKAAIILANGVLPISKLENQFGLPFELDDTLFDIISNNQLEELSNWTSNLSEDDINKMLDIIIPSSEVLYAPPYRHPKKIWGIGLNYVEHASDLETTPPTEYPVGFLKPDTTVIGHRQTIKIPKLSERTTGEAELGIIIGKECKNIDQNEWLDYVAGFTTIIDITAEDILKKNTRYLGLSKSFDTFFSFGPHIMTPDEIPDLSALGVTTLLNNEIVGRNTVGNMRFALDYLVAFYSRVMTLLPGDIISTGTPRAGVLSHGDTIECHIDGFMPLINLVQDLKV